MIQYGRWSKVAAIVMLMAPLPINAGIAPHWRGDVNNDGKVDIADVAEMTRLLVTYSKSPKTALEGNAALDTSKDGRFNMMDIQALLDMIFGKREIDNLNQNSGGGGYSDTQQGAPGGNGSFNDNELESPETEGSNGIFRDDQQKDPK